MEQVATTDGDTNAGAASRCPIDHTAASPGCPVDHSRALPMGRADVVARRVLRIGPRPAHITDAQAYSAFQKSMLISATRCTLTYVVFPFVLPAVGVATGVGPLLGVIIGVVALVCDVFSIRRFHMVGHRWRWHFTVIALCVMSLLAVLLVQDLHDLFT